MRQLGRASYRAVAALVSMRNLHLAIGPPLHEQCGGQGSLRRAGTIAEINNRLSAGDL